MTQQIGGDGATDKESLDVLLDGILDEFENVTQPEQRGSKPQQPAGKRRDLQNPTDADLLDSMVPDGLEDVFVKDILVGMEQLMAGMPQQEGSNGTDSEGASADEIRQQLLSLLQQSNANSSQPYTDENIAMAELLAKGLMETLQSDSSVAAKEQNGAASDNAPETLLVDGLEMEGVPPSDTTTTNFQDTLKQTMERIQNSSERAENELLKESTGGGLDEKLLQQMMNQLGLDQAGTGFESNGTAASSGGGGFESMVDAMMSQLMSRDILYEPLQDLARKYPEWLEANSGKLSPAELSQYRQQHDYCLQIIRVFDDDVDNKSGSKSLRVAELMQKMQECGSPPADILRDLAPGLEFDKDGLPNLNGPFGNHEGNPAEDCKMQ